MNARTSNDRVAVLGAGFLGCHLAGAAAARGLATRLLSRSGPVSAIPVGGVDVVTGDIQDPGALARALEGAAHVVYTAGGLLPAASQLDPGRDVTLTLPPLIAALEALRDRSGVTFTYISSGGTVYGRPRTLPVAETHPTEPISSYGVLKLAGEHLTRITHEQYGLPTRVLRVSNVYGEHQSRDRPQGAIGAFLHRVAHNEPLMLYGDGHVVRDYVYVGDFTHAVLTLLDRPDAPHVLNVGSGVGTSLNEVVEQVGRVTGASLAVERLPARALDIDEIVLDISQLRAAIPYEPRPLEAGIAAVWDAMRAEAPVARAR